LLRARNSGAQFGLESPSLNFDHSLGTAINKLREVLGDSEGRPRWCALHTVRPHAIIVRPRTRESALLGKFVRFEFEHA
jgi:hypothetical protein